MVNPHFDTFRGVHGNDNDDISCAHTSAMLYELIAVVRPGSLAEVKDIARTAGSLILQNGGTIRGITNWGVTALPKRTTKHQAVYHDGHHFVMRYDANSAVQDQGGRFRGRPGSAGRRPLGKTKGVGMLAKIL
ncbi:hypothetical protein V500_09914 [Pseudogymnoascus sp. VKM F-4518 (FW-2643)]|nr:hypothetical protein V500_09914 [Pseudogymnoascus sp. VKM F-4518 (FW-2643)]KFZ20673.1 hypothetical protein V502_03086 [Pseudogymnoascus sp. VKM F-4520 (FW-2644)]